MDIKEVRINRIKDRMNELGLNSRELAKRSSVSESGISRILTGEIDPRLKTFVKIADALKCDYVWLMGYDDDENETKHVIIEYEKLTPANQTRLLAYYQALIDSQEDEK